jgi:hypothetical protein
MSLWQIPQNLMSIRTSCSPSSRRSIVVASNDAPAEGALSAGVEVIVRSCHWDGRRRPRAETQRRRARPGSRVFCGP